VRSLQGLPIAPLFNPTRTLPHPDEPIAAPVEAAPVEAAPVEAAPLEAAPLEAKRLEPPEMTGASPPSPPKRTVVERPNPDAPLDDWIVFWLMSDSE
jgi:hypothetical protein